MDEQNDTDGMEKRRESRLRNKARTQGFSLRKSRARTTSVRDYGGYQIVVADGNIIDAGEKFDLSLDEVERFLSDTETER
jgi:hypothetical protein